MTSYEFEVAAKNAAIDLIEYHTREQVPIEKVHTVWFAHVLGHKKCLLFAETIPNVYIEVTYNTIECEMYVDLYEKHLHQKLLASKFNLKAKRGVSNEKSIYLHADDR